MLPSSSRQIEPINRLPTSGNNDLEASNHETANPKERLGKTRQRVHDTNHVPSSQFVSLLMRLWLKRPAVHVRWRRKPLGIGILIGYLFAPVMALSCLTCVPTPDSTQLDRFRVTTRLNKPFCPLEPLQCDRDQDVCVTITMHIGHGEYWIGSGCDRRSNFPQLSCHNVRTLTRSVQIGNYVQEQRRLQRVCVCARDLCNSSSTSIIHLVILFVLICLLQ